MYMSTMFYGETIFYKSLGKQTSLQQAMGKQTLPDNKQNWKLRHENRHNKKERVVTQSPNTWETARKNFKQFWRWRNKWEESATSTKANLYCKHKYHRATHGLNKHMKRGLWACHRRKSACNQVFPASNVNFTPMQNIKRTNLLTQTHGTKYPQKSFPFFIKHHVQMVQCE